MDTIQSKYIEDLYIEMFDKLMVYARSTLRIEALAEEAVQETFRVACQKPEQLCGSPNPQGWLVLTLRNIIRNTQISRASDRALIERYLTAKGKERAISTDHHRFSFLYEDITQTEEFRLLSELILEGKSYKEMAQARGLTVIAVKKRVQRAKEKLQKNF